MQAGQRTGEVGNLIRYDAMAEGGVALAVLVGVDQQFIDLRRETFDDVLRQWLTIQKL
jgi:hypothetical protein